ncbi:unnamed protein product [Effrenium voratum]|uniref:Cysteine synthase n=1 Tax=Effrenium voratum TaxID=2562239 RepID=A0AA36JA57_9DINO|nr:unnamed protein product [Effrenium voratum]CAJ1402453.1 unnamed protein product [Effrenium voratum]
MCLRCRPWRSEGPEDCVGNTPLVRLQRMAHASWGSVVLCKLEGDNPAGSVKDRPALSMIRRAEEAGRIRPGDTLIEATSGNTGIALAAISAIKGYKLKLIMPENMSLERRASMAVYGAELILVSQGAMEEARDLAQAMQARGEGIVLDQFANPDNPQAHYETTGPELLRQTQGRITHFVSSMGTTGTAMGTSRYFKEAKPEVQIIGLQPAAGAQIPGIRRWPKEYLPSIFEESRLDRVIDISQEEADETARQLAMQEGIFAGMSSGGAVSAALKIAQEAPGRVVVCIVCDRGDRYLSTGVFDPVPPLHHSCSAASLDATLAHVRRTASRTSPATRLFVLFTAPWCPDCQTALPVVDGAFGDSAGAALLRCVVSKTREEWKDPGHTLRHDRRWSSSLADGGLKAVPTLAFLGTVERPLEQPVVDAPMEAMEASQIRGQVRAFVAKHAG